MAKKLNAVTVSAIFLVVFLIASYSVGAAKEAGAEGEVVFPEQLCERASQTWSGDCKNTKNCDNQCIQWEKARHGACHKRGGKWMCFCYFDKC
uniref:Plant defensin n=1 Tax=Bupleurum kaoi TaxID=270183 RepID=E8ZB57_9APIA|nr:plant defensin [Bupleurum kaoi]